MDFSSIGGLILEVGGALSGIIAATVVAAKSLVFVREKQDVIVESFGRYAKTLNKSGLRIKAPWQKVANRVTKAMVEWKEDLGTKTKDDIFVTLPIKMHLQVEDSKKYHYESTNTNQQIMSRVAATVKVLTSNMDFAELYQARETISEQARQKVGAEISSLYGMKLVDVIVDEPHAPEEIKHAYNNVKASQSKMQAAKNDAEAEKIKIIAEAEARKEAQRLDGEGIAAQRSAIFNNYSAQIRKLEEDGLTRAESHQLIMLAMQSDTMRRRQARQRHPHRRQRVRHDRAVQRALPRAERGASQRRGPRENGAQDGGAPRLI
jgi:regulator of protease activity HflC (stomatin/prohibitin superfamily)